MWPGHMESRLIQYSIPIPTVREVAMMHLFSMEIDKALECIMEAQHIQYNIQTGEDTILTNYCYACILLELASKQSDSDPEKERDTKRNLDISLEHAIDGGEEFGINPAHSLICLAQFYLGSSMYSTGWKTDSDGLMSAERLLERVAARNLLSSSALRTQCHYYYTLSDLCRIRGELERARDSAYKAIDIAVANGFTADIKSAKARLEACLCLRANAHSKNIFPISAHQLKLQEGSAMASGGTDVTGMCR